MKILEREGALGDVGRPRSFQIHHARVFSGAQVAAELNENGPVRHDVVRHGLALAALHHRLLRSSEPRGLDPKMEHE